MILRSLAALVATASLAFASSSARNPLQFLAKVESPSIQTGNHRIHALSSFDISLNLYQTRRRLKFSLEPNHDVLPEGASISFLAEDGTISHAEPINRLDHKVFRGTTHQEREDGTWQNVGWARLTVLRDGIKPLFHGAFTVNRDTHHIQTGSNYMDTRHEVDPEIEPADDEYMVVWRDSDVAPNSHQSILSRSLDDGYTCSSDYLQFNTRPDHPVYNNIMKRDANHWGAMPLGSLFGKRQIDNQPGNGNSAGVNLVSTIGQTSGCPNTRKVALVGVAADCTYTGTFNSTESLRSYVIQQMNSASSLWESAFNISLGLQNLTVSKSDCPGAVQEVTPWNQNCESGADITDRLNLFSGWRGSLTDSNSHWTLLTNCNTGSAIGLAWLGQACIHGSNTANNTGGASETVSGANVVAKTSTEWQVIAHETGHTYGAVHDCTEQTCASSNTVSSQQCCPLSSGTCNAGEQYIMNPYTVAGINHFSACTIGNICSGIGRNAINTTCLKDNKGVVTISGQQCGNGIVEAGEECDCGGESGCGDDPCCDAKSCKFKGSAVCDDANEDCCNNCQFAANSTICRPSTGSCDPAESCSGSSGSCPSDVTAPDGQSCKVGSNVNTAHLDTSELACAAGQCTSRDLQCQTVMGGYTNGSNDTYACDDSSCTMSCASPAFGPGTCYGLQQNLLDGTPCGGGGKCSNGQCKGSSTGKEIVSWIDDHKALVIGIASGVGALVLLMLACCIYSCCCGRRKQPPKQPMPPNGSWYSPPPPVPIHGQPIPSWEEQPGWRPPPPRSLTSSSSQHGLYGNGIIGNQQRTPPPQPYPMQWNNGGWNGPSPPMNMRYA